METTGAPKLPEAERIRGLIERLRAHDWQERKEAAERLSECGEGAIPQLCERLLADPPDENVDYWAVRVLERSGAAGLDPLLAIYAKRSRDARFLPILLRALRVHADERVIDLLIRELGNERWALRQEAARSLLKIGKPAVPKLKAAFNDGNKDVRYWTVKTLGQILGDQSIDPFLKLLASPRDDLRYYAVTALGEIPAARTIGALIGAFSDRSWLVRNQAADLLEKKGQAAVEPLVAAFTGGDADTRYWALRTLTRILRERAIDRLKGFLKEDETDLKFHFIASLQEIGNAPAIELLIGWLDESTWLIRKAAADALVKIGGATVGPLERALARTDNENIRYWGVRALAKLGETGLPALLAFLSRCDRRERTVIVQALQELDSPRVIRPLLALLEDEAWPVRNAAADALAQVSPGMLARELAEGFDEDSPHVRFWLRNVLREAGTAFVDEVAKLLSGNELSKPRLFRILSFVATDPSVDRILAALREGQLPQREELISSLSDAGDPDFAKLLLRRLETVAPELAFWVVRLLIATKRVTPELVLHEIPGASPDKLVWLAKIMGELRDGAFLDPLVRLLSNPHRQVRYEATKILARFGGADLSAVLLERFLDETEDGRIAIMENLKELGSEELVRPLVAKLEAENETTAYWIAKLLAECAKDRKELFVRFEREAPRGSRTAYWAKRIIEHIDGRSYL